MGLYGILAAPFMFEVAKTGCAGAHTYLEVCKYREGGGREREREREG
jgi:hypothetical protein